MLIQQPMKGINPSWIRLQLNRRVDFWNGCYQSPEIAWRKKLAVLGVRDTSIEVTKMPMIIECIDDYFHRKNKDLYLIVFGEGRDWRIDPFSDGISDNPPGREELLAWFSENLPETEIRPLFTFGWNSGFISARYDGTISVDFDEESLATYCARWETASGDPVDPRFKCYWLRLSDYLKKHGGKLPEKPDYDDL